MRMPDQILAYVNKLAVSKASTPNRKVFAASILAGAYIAFGGLLALMVGGGLPGIAASNPGLKVFLFGAVFPVGLMLVAVAGAELFTGNTAYFAPSILSRRLSFKDLARNWGIVYIGNFVGSILVAYFFAYQTDLLQKDPWQASVQAIVEAKTNQSFYKAFIKGIACNWLVALAMWMSFASKSIGGKILAIWFPIMAFVAMGFEHSVANMFFIPTGIFYGAELSWGQFLVKNLLPVTLGNIVGGGFFVGTFYWFLYEKRKEK